MASPEIFGFRGAAGRPFQNFKDCYEEYAKQNFKEFCSNENVTGHVFMIPPIFSYKFTQPALLQLYPKPSGALSKLKDGTRQNLIGELAEHKVYEVLEQFYNKSVRNVLILHGFAVDDLKRDRLKRFFPGLILDRFETDFVIFLDDGTVINVEVKGEDVEQREHPNRKQQERKFAEARKQLRAIETALVTLAKFFNIICDLSTVKIVVMPNVLYKPSMEGINIHLCSGDTWQTELEQKLHSVYATCNGITNNHREAITQLVKIVCAIKALEVVTHEGTEWISVSKSSRLSVVALEESKRVQEHRVIDDLATKLESDMQRTSKIVLQGEKGTTTEKKVTLYDVLKVYFLTPEQLMVWQAANKRQILVGVAGTGKTLLLLGRTVLLLESNEKVIFIGADSMQNKLKNHLHEQSKHSTNLMMLSPYEFLMLPDIKPLAEVARKLYKCLFRFVEERLNIQVAARLKNIFKLLDYANESNDIPLLNSNEKQRVAKCLKDITDVFADTFRELAEDDRDPAHSISYPTGKHGDVLNCFVEFFHLNISDLNRQVGMASSFFVDKNIMIDDLLSLSSSSAIAECGHFWLFIAFLLPHCTNPNKYCWVAMDYMQMLVQDSLARCICKGIDTVFNRVWNERSTVPPDEQLEDPTCSNKERADLYESLLSDALVQITALFDAPNIFEKQYFSTNLLGTVMRCTTKVFDTWKTTYASALSETSLDGTMLAASKLCTGHRFVGVEPRCLTVQDSAGGLKEIKRILKRDVIGSTPVIMPSDLAILVMENDSCNGVLFQYLQQELTAWLEKFGYKVCGMADQPLHRNAIAVGKASESASQEWTLVILITDIIQDDVIQIQKYLGLSRCIEWLNLIQITD